MNQTHQSERDLASPLPRYVFWIAQLYVALMPYELFLERTVGVSTIFKPYRVLAILLLAALILNVAFNQGRFKLRTEMRLMLVILLWGLILAMVHMLITNKNIDDTLNALKVMAFPFSFALVAQAFSPTSQQIKRLILVYLIGSTIAIILANLVFESTELRASGFYENPNRFAVNMVLIIVFCFYFASHSRGIARYLLVGVILAAVVNIFLSSSRGGLVSLAACFLVISYFMLRRRSAGTFIAIAAVTLVGSYVLISEIRKGQADTGQLAQIDRRLSSEDISKGAGRFDLWRSGLLVGIDSYFLGIGYNNYRNLHSEYITRIDLFKDKIADHDELGLHSDLMTLLVEFGLPALLIYILLIYRLFSGALYRFRRADPADKMLILTLIVAGVCVVVQGFLRNSLLTMDYWFCLGLLFFANYARIGMSNARLTPLESRSD